MKALIGILLIFLLGGMIGIGISVIIGKAFKERPTKPEEERDEFEDLDKEISDQLYNRNN